MSPVLLPVAAYCLNALWQTPLLFAAAGCLARWLQPAGPAWPHRLWVAVLLLAVLLPAASISAPSFVPPPPSPAPTGTASPASPISAIPGYPLFSARIVLSPRIITLLAGLYSAAFLIFLIRLSVLITRTAALVTKAQPVSLPPEYGTAWEQTKRRFSLPAACLLQSDMIPGPVTAGLRHPVVLLPVGFSTSHSEQEFLAALAHEAAHLQRHDFRKNLLYEAVALPIAFHPVTWLIKAQLSLSREMVCDQMAARQMPDRRTYGKCLLQIAAKMPPAAPAAVFHAIGMLNHNVLERRIMNLMTSTPQPAGLHRFLLGGAAVALLTLCATLAGALSRPIAAQSLEQNETPNLDCTYYERGIPSPGTCSRDQNDTAKFVCRKNSDPAQTQSQLGCEWKVLRAEKNSPK